MRLLCLITLLGVVGCNRSLAGRAFPSSSKQVSSSAKAEDVPRPVPR